MTECVKPSRRIIDVAGNFPGSATVCGPRKPCRRRDKNTVAEVGENVSTPNRIGIARVMRVCGDRVFVVGDEGVVIGDQTSGLTPCITSVAGAGDQHRLVEVGFVIRQAALKHRTVGRNGNPRIGNSLVVASVAGGTPGAQRQMRETELPSFAAVA